MREVEKQRDVRVEWRLFSLELIHEDNDDPLADVHKTGTPALRTLALVRREHDSDGVARLYAAIGQRVHEDGEKLSLDVVRRALTDTGFDEGLVDRALADDATMTEVRKEHEEAVTRVGAFGVPTIILESGRGIFGPVVAMPPRGESASEMWDHVRYLIDADGFFELKRERDREPGETMPSA